MLTGTNGYTLIGYRLRDLHCQIDIERVRRVRRDVPDDIDIERVGPRADLGEFGRDTLHRGGVGTSHVRGHKPDLDTPIPRSALGRGVARNGLAIPVATHDDPVARNPVGREIAHHRRGASRR